MVVFKFEVSVINIEGHRNSAHQGGSRMDRIINPDFGLFSSLVVICYSNFRVVSAFYVIDYAMFRPWGVAHKGASGAQKLR